MRRRTAMLLALLLGVTVYIAVGLLHFGTASPAGASDVPLSIASGAGHSCAVPLDGPVQCWGENSAGQLGDGGTDDSAQPVSVCAPLSVAGSSGGIGGCCPVLLSSVFAGLPTACYLSGIYQVAAGFAHTCGLTTAGTVMCWGDNSAGQLGNRSNDASSYPVDVCDPTVVIAGGSPGSTCCVIILAQSPELAPEPQAPLPGCGTLDGVVQITAGAGHTCALRDTGNVWCWGNNSDGQLGDGSTDPSNTPVEVCASGVVILSHAGGGFPCTPLSDVSAISAGGAHTCALITGGAVVCWGDNESGQLGDGSNFDSNYPVDVCEPGLLVAGNPCCFVSLAGQDDAHPQAPLPGCYLSDVTAIAAGGEHTCALLADTGVVCWGNNEHGELGAGVGGNSSMPLRVCGAFDLAVAGFNCCPIILGAGGVGGCPLLTGVESISAGFEHTCTVMVGDGGVRCWGYGTLGKLGAGEFDSSVAVRVCDKEGVIAGVLPSCGELSGAALVAPGWWHTCSIMDDKRVLCWGDNTYGQLGDGTNDGRYRPAEVLGFGAKGGPTPTMTTAPIASATPSATPTAPAATHTPTTAPGATSTPTRTPTNMPASTSTPTAGPGLNGDVNCDGTVNAIDAAFILQMVAGLIDDVPCPQNADVNDDGNINPVDSALILQYTAGLIPGL